MWLSIRTIWQKIYIMPSLNESKVNKYTDKHMTMIIILDNVWGTLMHSTWYR